MDVTVPVAVPEAVAAGVVDADSAAAPPAAAAPPPVAPLGLPSTRLARLAARTATELAGSADDGGAAGPQVLLSGRALAEVLAAVDASTAANTKKAYRSAWVR